MSEQHAASKSACSTYLYSLAHRDMELKDAIELKGAKAPSLPIGTVHIERRTTPANTRLPNPFPSEPANHGNKKPWTHVDMNEGVGVQGARMPQQPPMPHTMKKPNRHESVQLSGNIFTRLKQLYGNEGVGVQEASDHTVTPTGNTISAPNLIPCTNLLDYSILLQQQPSMRMAQTMKKPNGYELLGAGVEKNMLPTASQTSVFGSCSRSAVVETQLSPPDPPTRKRATQRLFDLNLEAPEGQEDDEDERPPSFTLSLGLNFLKKSCGAPKDSMNKNSD